MSRKAPRVDSAAWARHKEEIISLYRESSLKETMVNMNEKHGFQASESQYRARLKSWKIGKHATPNAWVFIDGRLKKRTRAGKKTDVLLYGELQPPPKVAKEIARNVTVFDSLQDLSDVTTPDGVEILTPCAVSPIDSGVFGISLTESMSYSEFVGVMTPWIVGIVAAHTPLYPPDPPSQLSEMFRRRNINQSSEPLLQSLLSDLTKYVTNKRFNDLLKYWGEDYSIIRALAGFQHIDLAQVAQAVLLMVHILLYEVNNIHDRLEPSDAVFILREYFPSAFKDICDLRSSSWQILSRTFLDAAVAKGDIEWTELLLQQGVTPYSNSHLLGIALSTRNSTMIDLLWQSGLADHVSFQDLDSLEMDVRFVVLCNLLRSRVTGPTRLTMVEREYSRLAERYCGIVLVEAASKGRTIEVTVLTDFLGSAIDPSCLSVALRAAAAFRHFRTAEYLINSGADIHASGGSTSSILLYPKPWSLWIGMTPIQIAAENNDIDLVKLLLHHGAKPNPFQTGGSAELLGMTALQYAAKNSNFDMVRVLLDAGSHPDSGVDVTLEDTPLQISIRQGDEQIYGLLLSSGVDVNSRPAHTNGRTAIQAAAGTGNIRVAQMLIQEGAFLHAEPGIEKGMTALQAAAFGGHSAMIELLVANGADVNAAPATSGGMTALQAAAAGGNHEIVKTLIRLGADVGYPTVSVDGKPPLQAAVPLRDIDMLEILISHGAEVNTGHSFAQATALETACEIGWLEGAKYLLRHGATVNALVTGRGSALGWAITNNDLPMVQLLLENGVIAGISTTYFTLVLCHSLSEGNDATIVRALLQHDPDPEKTFRDGQLVNIALQHAYPHLEVYQLLLEKMTGLPKPMWLREVQMVWSYMSGAQLLPRMDSAFRISIVDLLLNAGANIDGPSEMIGTCLQVALGQGDEKLADYLLSRGAHSDGPATRYFGTPLQEAIANGCYSIIPKLLRNGADVDAAPCLDPSRAISALQAAAEKGLLNVARILLEAGADVTACRTGTSAIQLAALKGRADMVALLLQSLPLDNNLIAACMTAACMAGSNNYVELGKWLTKYPASRRCGTMEL